MEIKSYFAQDAQGNIMPSAECYLYAPGTTSLSSGLVDISGKPLSNPFQASSIGKVQFGAPNGIYDLRIKKGTRDQTIRIQCADILQAINETAAFLGAHPSAPTTRNDGSPLQLADRYLNTTDQFEYIYKSTGWVANNIDAQILAESDGATLIGATIDGVGGTVQESIDEFVDFKKNLQNIDNPVMGSAMLGRGLQVVGSVAEIRLLSKNSPSKSAFSTGYYATGDGGGGSYTLDASDTTSADDGGSVIVASDGGRWKLQFTQRTLDLKQFGAQYGTDSSGKIQSAISAMWKKYGGGVVGFSGSLRTDNQVLLYPNVELRGAGLDNSTIDTYVNNAPAFLTHRPEGYVPGSCIGAGLAEFGMANRATIGYGLDLNTARNCTVHRVSFALYEQGLSFNRTVSSAGTIPNAGEAYFNTVTQCDFISCGRARAFYGAANRNTFNTNTIRNCLVGEDFSGQYNTAETNTYINENWEGTQYPFLYKEPEFEPFIYTQTYIGCTVENPSNNSFRCSLFDPGHQTIINMSVIGVVDIIYPNAGKRSNWIGRGTGDRVGDANSTLSEPVEFWGGIILSGTALRGVTTLNQTFTVETNRFIDIPVTGAEAGDFAIVTLVGGTGNTSIIYLSAPLVSAGSVRVLAKSIDTTTISGCDVYANVIKRK